MAVPDVSGKTIPQLFSLAGRRAVVTGGAQGLGKAIASRLAEAGASVLIADLNEELAKAAAGDLRQSFGGQVAAIAADVTKEGSVAAAADYAVAEFGGIDIWVNNAGIFPNQSLAEMSVDTWDKVMGINLRGIFLGSREAARCMGAVGRGVIINIVSAAGFRGGSPGMAAYATSKHGVVGATKQMAIELARQGIRVLGVAPTYCVTEGTTAAMRAGLAARGLTEVPKDLPQLSTTRLGRTGVPDDIGRVVLFCASDMAIFMTGTTLMVDAGETA